MHRATMQTPRARKRNARVWLEHYTLGGSSCTNSCPTHRRRVVNEGRLALHRDITTVVDSTTLPLQGSLCVRRETTKT